MKSTILFPLVAAVAPTCIALACSSPGEETHEAIAHLRATFRDRAGQSVIDRGARADGPRAARVELPALASERVKLSDGRSGMEIAFTIVGANPGVEVVEDELAVYVGGGPSGGDVVRRLRSVGVEDFVTLPSRPPRDELRYRVELGGVAGLRLVGGVLELLDEGGAPRLRVTRPYVVDARGERIEARLDVEGCAADRSFEPPWGRPVTAPGSTSCDLVLRWDGDALAYPAIVDPGWSTTAELSLSRWEHTANLVYFPGKATGLVLVAGGIIDTFDDSTETCALYDPISQTWGMAAPMKATRERHVSMTLTDGRVLVAGGYGQGGTLWSSAEIFDPNTSTWSPAASMSEGRFSARATLLRDSTVLVTGGYNFNAVSTDAFADEIATAEIYLPGANQWTSAGTMSSPRGEHTATLDANGNVLVAGGGHGVTATMTQTAELFLTKSKTWMPLPNMPATRTTAAAVRLGDKILVGGGSADPATSVLFDTTMNSWGAVVYIDPPPPAVSWSQRLNPTLTLLPNGAVLIAGGFMPESSVIYDPCTGTWVAPEPMSSFHMGHTATLLDDGSVLVVGGADPLGPGSSAEPVAACEVFTLAKSGGACTFDVECASGWCSGHTCVGPDTPVGDAGRVCDHDAGAEAGPDAANDAGPDAGPDATPAGIEDRSYLSCASRVPSGDPRALALGLIAALALLRRSRS
jgi:hypothetical protein